MKPTPKAATSALTEAEFDRLGDFLASLPGEPMNLEMVDGFFSAMHCGPQAVPPSVWLPMVWGPEADASAAFESAGEARSVTGLLVRHGQVVGEELARALARPGDDAALRRPLLLAGASGGQDWAHGFVRAMALAPEAWQAVLDDPARAEALGPVLALHHEGDPDPARRTPPIDPADREALLADLVIGLDLVHRDLAAARREAARADRQALTFRRSAPKAGRNDPCPCGSGRKFKLCCAVAPSPDAQRATSTA